MMSMITTAARTALNFAALIAFAVPPAANAAAPANPIARPPGSNPYQPVVQNDVTAAYQFRTRILVSPPSCARFATDADNAFLSGTLDDKTKTEQLKAISAATAAAGCLGP
jgi:hypothetical protein